MVLLICSCCSLHSNQSEKMDVLACIFLIRTVYCVIACVIANRQLSFLEVSRQGLLFRKASQYIQCNSYFRRWNLLSRWKINLKFILRRKLWNIICAYEFPKIWITFERQQATVSILRQLAQSNSASVALFLKERCVSHLNRFVQSLVGFF